MSKFHECYPIVLCEEGKSALTGAFLGFWSGKVFRDLDEQKVKAILGEGGHAAIIGKSRFVKRTCDRPNAIQKILLELGPEKLVRVFLLPIFQWSGVGQRSLCGPYKYQSSIQVQVSHTSTSISPHYLHKFKKSVNSED